MTARRLAVIGGSAVLIVLGLLLMFAATMSVGSTTLSGTAEPAPATLTVQIVGHEYVHPVGHGGCYVAVPGQDYTVEVFDATGAHTVGKTMSGTGRLTADGGCHFSSTMPALFDADQVVVRGAVHAITRGVGVVILSADDGQWSVFSAVAT